MHGKSSTSPTLTFTRAAAIPMATGVSNAVEFADGTNPNDATSAKYALTLSAYGGSAGKSPNQTNYNRGAVVNLTNTGNGLFIPRLAAGGELCR